MKIGTFPDRSSLTRWRLPVLFRRQRFLFLFLGYNLLLVAAGATLFFTEVHAARRQRIMHMLVERSQVKELWRKLGYAIRGESKPPEPVVMDMAPAQWQMLSAARARALGQGLSQEETPGVFPLTLGHHGRRVNGEISLEEEGGAWPLVVRLKGEGDLFGMKTFGLYPSNDGDLSDEWLMATLFADAGVSGRRQDLVLLDLGGSNRQVCLLKEQVDTELVDPEKYQRSQRVIDKEKLAVHLALLELTGNSRSSALDSLHFHLNSGKMDPVLSRAGPAAFTEEHGLLGASKNAGRSLEEGTAAAGTWYEVAFADEHFFRSYIRALERIAVDSFLDDFFLRHEREWIALEKAMKRTGQSGALTCKDILYENHRFINKALHPAKLLQPYFRKEKTAGGVVCLDVQNIHNLPAEVTGASIGDSISLKPSGGSRLLPGSRHPEPLPVRSICFSLPEGITWADSLLTGLTVSSRILGSERTVKDAVIPYSLLDEELLAGDLIRQKPNFRDFGFLRIEEERRRITFPAGKHRVDKTLIIPRGYQVFAEAGARTDVVNHANIISYSPVFWEGSAGNPVSFFSSDSTAQGIVISASGEKSRLGYVHFDNLSIPIQSAWSLTAAITFYESPVHIDHCLFNRNRIGDDFLNIVRTDYTIQHSVFRYTNADAFDGDFSDGTIRNTRFFHPGNDGIDVSGSHITLEDIDMEGVGDKAISIGENSTMKGRGIRIKDAELGITAKDLSTVVIDDVRIENSRIAFIAFQKKPEYGPATIYVTGRSQISGKTEIAYLIEGSSRLTIAGEDIKSSVHVDRVREILYGVEFGKASR